MVGREASNQPDVPPEERQAAMATQRLQARRASRFASEGNEEGSHGRASRSQGGATAEGFKGAKGEGTGAGAVDVGAVGAGGGADEDEDVADEDEGDGEEGADMDLAAVLRMMEDSSLDDAVEQAMGATVLPCKLLAPPVDAKDTSHVLDTADTADHTGVAPPPPHGSVEGKAKKKKKKKRKKKTAKAEAATGILAVPGPDSRASPSFFTDMGIDQRAAEHLSKHLSAEDQAKIKEMGEAKLKQHFQTKGALAFATQPGAKEPKLTPAQERQLVAEAELARNTKELAEARAHVARLHREKNEAASHKSGNISRVGIVLDFVRRSGTTRAEGQHVGPQHVREANRNNRNRVDHSRAQESFCRSFPLSRRRSRRGKEPCGRGTARTCRRALICAPKHAS